jgi:hypothetical protein
MYILKLLQLLYTKNIKVILQAYPRFIMFRKFIIIGLLLLSSNID